MGTISSAFSLISQALDADQSGLSIVANNVANANTTGYTEENPNWQENQPIEINGVSYGTGVTETGPTSVRDKVLEERLNQQQQLASASGTRLTALDTLQALFTPASGSSSSTAGNILSRRWRPILPTMQTARQCFRQRKPWRATYRVPQPA